MAEKKAKKAVEDAKENKVNELLRRKAGQVRERLLLGAWCVVVVQADFNAFIIGPNRRQGGFEAQTSSEGTRAEETRFVLIPLSFVRSFLLHILTNTSSFTFTKKNKIEKIEEARAKAAIKAQIEADKKARAERTAKEKALREGKEWTDAGAVDKPGSSAPVATSSAATGVKGSEYKETRLQVGQL